MESDSFEVQINSNLHPDSFYNSKVTADPIHFQT
jgi:hypothetical protein